MEATDELINQRAKELCELHHSIMKDATTHIKRAAAWDLFDKSYHSFLTTFKLSGRIEEQDGKYNIAWKRFAGRAA